MAPGPLTVRLHIGAHKTATTHLQDNLAAQESTILRNGWAYLPRPMLRGSGLMGAVFGQFQALQQQQGARRLTLAEMINPPPHIPRRFILSEEDILGSSADVIGGVYPHARARLAAWAVAAPPATTAVFLAIRDYAGLLPSAYSQALRDGSPVRPFAAYRDLWLGGSLGWPGLVATILDVYRGASLTVWTMERYLENPGAVLSAFAGMPLPEVKKGAPAETTRLSADLVRKLEALDPALPFPARREAAQKITAAAGSGGTRYDPLSADEKSQLSARYKADVETIRKMPVTFIG